MAQLPFKQDINPRPAYVVTPDNIKGGWLVYITTDPQEPQRHFDTKEQAVSYAGRKSTESGIGFMVEEYESPSFGRLE